MAKLIKNWEELAKVEPNEKYKIIVLDCCGWIVPIYDEIDKDTDFKCKCDDSLNFYDNHVYLNTHTFYGCRYEQSTKILQSFGFDIEIDNWDKGRDIW